MSTTIQSSLFARLRSRFAELKGVSSFLTAAMLLCPIGELAAAPVINEIMYRPGTTYPEDETLEFIEIYNPDSSAVDMSGWAFTKGVTYTFPSGTSIAAGGYLVVAANVTNLKAKTGLSTVYGPWTGSLSDKGESLVLAKEVDAVWETVDKVSYADEGDWATRTRDSLGGWSWVTTSKSGGCSTERRNPTLLVNSGQNWGASTTVGGTPGKVNTLYSTNVAPVITEVKHSPAVPTSSDTVTISCQLTDELTTDKLAVTLYYRSATSTSPGSYTAVTMGGDSNGVFSATLPVAAAKTIIEFYVSATDGTSTRTWPAATSESQNANCMYQVDDETVSGSAPYYRIIMTAAENAAFEAVSSSSNRLFNMTLVVTKGEETTIRYRTSMRIRGYSSRSYTFRPMRISIPTDDTWDGVSDFNLAPKSPWLQYFAMRLQQAAGLVAADTTPVELRRQGKEYTTTSGSAQDYGKWARVEEFNGDYLDNHFPNASSANLYRKESSSYWSSNNTAPSSPDTLMNGWSKQNAHGANDWSDVINFCSAWQTASADHFSGYSSGNVASGTWKSTGFTDAQITTLSKYADLDYMAKYFAIMTIMLDNEPNLSTGEDDDYAAAFVSDGTNTRFIPLPHDMDTILGVGDESVAATAVGLYDATETDTFTRAGVGSVTLFKPLLPLMGNSTTAGNAAWRAKYYAAIRELFGTIFDADTSSNSNPPFYQFVDKHLSDWAPATVRTAMKTWMTKRQAYLLGLIGEAKTTPATATSTATSTASSTPTLRINEVLATNSTTLLNGTSYPDIIELYNAGTTAIDLSGKVLADADATYTIPSGTSIAAGATLVIYADDDTTTSGLHTGFSLDAEGDTVSLYDTTANGSTLLDTVSFGFQIPDYSIARTASAPGTWALCKPTIGATNGEAVTLGSVTKVCINEIAGNNEYRLEKDFIEFYNSGSAPAPLADARLTDDLTNYPSRYVFPALSFIAPTGFLFIETDKLDFNFDGDFDNIHFLGSNGTEIDQADMSSQAADHSFGRTTDGGSTWSDFSIPTPGITNTSTLTTNYSNLLTKLRITEIMYNPLASSSASNYEFIELLNIGTTTLDLSGVRFTNGLTYTFPSGTTLASGAYIVVCKTRSSFLSRYPSASGALASDSYSGALANEGEQLNLTLPSPWNLNIQCFKYDPTWYPTTDGEGYSLTTRSATTTLAKDWGEATTWRASSTLYGTPGSGDNGSVGITLGSTGTVTTTAGESTTLSVSVSSTSTVTYQWQYYSDGTWVDISGATSSKYVLTSTQAYQAGSYRVLVTTGGTTYTSDTITVSVASVSSSGTRLVNLSSRANSKTGDNVLITGFVVAGSSSKKVLVRGVGPTLTSMSVTGAMTDPSLVLYKYDSSTAAYASYATNDDWSSTDASNISTVAASVGAFALSNGTADSALVTTAPTGPYSAIISGKNSATGIVLAEIYDADYSTTTYLANISARAWVGTGDDQLIAGFVVPSGGSKTLLIRAVGPGLSAQGVSGYLADPTITLYQSSTAILTNDNWGTLSTASTTTSVGSALGAFSLSSGSKDAAFVVTLAPGVYSVIVSGASSTTGIALIEIYDAD